MSHFQNRDKGTEAESKLRHDLKDIASHSEQPRKKIETFRQEREQKPEEHDSLDKQCRELQETLRRKESYIKELETASGKSEGSRRTNKDGANRQSNDDLAQLEKVLGTSPILPVIDEAPSGQFDSDRAQISSANTGSPMSHNPPKAATAPGQTSTKFSTVLTRCQFGYGALALLAFLFLVYVFASFVSRQQEQSLLDRGDNRARLTLLSRRAGGGSGLSWASLLYDDKVLEPAGGFYG